MNDSHGLKNQDVEEKRHRETTDGDPKAHCGLLVSNGANMTTVLPCASRAIRGLLTDGSVRRTDSDHGASQPGASAGGGRVDH
jgi:hypothetical protein